MREHIHVRYGPQPEHERVLGGAYHTVRQEVPDGDGGTETVRFIELLVDLWKWRLTIRVDASTYGGFRAWAREAADKLLKNVRRGGE